MLRIVSTSITHEDDFTAIDHKVEGTVQLAGNSSWGYNGSQIVNVTGITVIEGETYKMIYVTHDTTWEIYTDSGFEKAISELLGYNVIFTEQGMQEDHTACMEAFT